MRRPRVQFATVTITPEMPRVWRLRKRVGFAVRLPDYFPMGERRHHIALTVLVLTR